MSALEKMLAVAALAWSVYDPMGMLSSALHIAPLLIVLAVIRYATAQKAAR